MQVTVEESGVIERKLTISVPSEQIETEITKRLRDVAKQARLPGFRPGKAPQSVIKQRYSPQVTNEVVSETINASYMDALGQEEIVPAGLISIVPTPYEQGKDLEYVATVELFPEIPSPTLEGVTVTKPIVTVADEDVSKTLEDIQKRNANFVEKDSKSETGDKLTIDFAGKIDGESFEGGTAEDFSFVLGEGQMLEEFDKGLLNVTKGETKVIAFSFPDNYGSPEVAGKDVEFSVTVKTVEKPELPDLDEKFAETLGIAEGGLDKMREEIKKNLDRELDTRLRSTIRNNVMDALLEKNSFEAPKALVEEEITRSVKAISEQMAAQGMSADNAENIDREMYAEEAKKRVRLGLIAREVIEQQEVKVSREDIKARVEEMASGYEESEAYVNWHMSDPERTSQIESMILEEKVVESMLQTAKVEEESISFSEFMTPKQES